MLFGWNKSLGISTRFILNSVRLTSSCNSIVTNSGNTFTCINISQKYNFHTSQQYNCTQIETSNINTYNKFPNLAKYLENIKPNISNALKVVEAEKQGKNGDELLLLLQSCGKAYPNYNPKVRAEVCKEIWKNLKYDGCSLQVQHYNTYLKICIENGESIDYKEFLSHMDCQPNTETLKLLLEAVCEYGDVHQTLNILNAMKEASIPVDEKVFNNLVLCHTIHGGLIEGKEVLKTMKTAHIAENNNTYWTLLRGLAIRNNEKEFKEVLEGFNLTLDFGEFLKLLSALAIQGNQHWLKLYKTHLKMENLPRELVPQLENFCIGLIHQGYSKSAMDMYCELVPSNQSWDYGIKILKEMLFAETPIDEVINIVKDLKINGFNELALEKITEIAHIEKSTTAAWNLLKHFDELRPHYFWPLLKSAANKGEVGIFEALGNMMKLGVKPDSETLEDYCIQSCDLANLNELSKKLQKLGIPRKQIVTSVLSVSLQIGDTMKAYQFYVDKDVAITEERIFVLLGKSWSRSKDTKHTILLLQRLCEFGNHTFDPVGTMLIHSFKAAKVSKTLEEYTNLIETIYQKNLRISNPSSDELLSLLKRVHKYNVADIENGIEKLTDIALREDTSLIPHPRNMNVAEMECHLIELQNKGMETRGIIRKLIQMHCRLRNYDRLQELRKLFVESGYEETAGMKSALMQSYIENSNLNLAMDLYNEIRNSHSEFPIDSFKIIDLAKLMVENDNYNDAVNMLETECKIRTVKDKKTLLRNCKELLEVAKNAEQVNKLFELLVNHDWCEPTNVLLGPIVRVHLRSNDLETAVKVYTKLAEKYRSTPLQLELLSKVVQKENRHLLQLVIDTTTKIHGDTATKCSLAAALAENELHGPLKKLIVENIKLPSEVLKKRYERWITEEKIHALQTMLKAAEGLPSQLLDVNAVHLAIMKIFSMKNDYKGAVNFWKSLEEKEVIPSRDLQQQYFHLLKKCKYRTAKSI